jgi:hypothetical protein
VARGGEWTERRSEALPDSGVRPEEELRVDLEEPGDAQCGPGLEGVDLTAQETTQVGVRSVTGLVSQPALGDVLHDHQGPEGLEVVKSHAPLPKACSMGPGDRTAMLGAMSSDT